MVSIFHTLKKPTKLKPTLILRLFRKIFLVFYSFFQIKRFLLRSTKYAFRTILTKFIIEQS